MCGELNQKKELAQIREQAVQWFVLMAGSPTRDARRAYWTWLKMSPLHVSAQLDIAGRYSVLRGSKLTADFERTAEQTQEPSNVAAFPASKRVRPVQRASLHWRQIAAGAFGGSAVCALLLSAVLVDADRSIETSAGEWRVLTLDDGSTAYLGPRTRMEIQFDRRSRRIHLSTGDVIFEVAKDSERAFWVDGDLATARAVGTRFGVTRDGDRMLVTVTEGIVQVAELKGSSNGAPAATASVIIGEQVVISPALFTPPRKVAVEHELAWADRHLVFDNHTLGYAAHEFNRRNRLQISVADSLTSHSIRGVFDAANPQMFVEFLQRADNLKVMREGPDLVRVEPTDL